ncbi:MAG TPA: DUF4258 domain-containing protein [Bacteriovoracaceae bacterium]|nr:DUF4258 domain-containing protein [Bacteriovoracaceae bacterium]
MSKKPKILRWFLSPHAAQRMLERHISVEELDLILSDPDQVTEQGPKYIFSKVIKSRKDNLLAAVVMEKKEGLWLVITIMINFERK